MKTFDLIAVAKLSVISLCVSSALGIAHAAGGKESVAICEDGAEWPPFHYIQRENGKKVPGKSAGYSVDVLNAIFKGTKYSVSKIDFVPWKRCLQQLLKGRYDLVLNASYNDERAKNYLYTKGYYQMRPSYFYSKDRFPDGLKNVTSGEALSKYKVCGITGYNYKGFDVDLSQLDTGSKNFASLVTKTRAGRCDAFIARVEALAGFKAIGSDYLKGKNIANKPIPGAKANQFYMIISKKSKHAKDLQKLLNQGIERLRSSGELDTMLQKYLK